MDTEVDLIRQEIDRLEELASAVHYDPVTSYQEFLKLRIARGASFEDIKELLGIRKQHIPWG